MTPLTRRIGAELGIEVYPITATLGAEVTGVDMADVDGVTLDQLKKAWLDHKVLVLRDQHITTEEHIAFGRLFGELEIHPFATGRRQLPRDCQDQINRGASIRRFKLAFRRDLAPGTVNGINPPREL